MKIRRRLSILAMRDYHMAFGTERMCQSPPHVARQDDTTKCAIYVNGLTRVSYPKIVQVMIARRGHHVPALGMPRTRPIVRVQGAIDSTGRDSDLNPNTSGKVEILPCTCSLRQFGPSSIRMHQFTLLVYMFNLSLLVHV
jgi:hypothetical protein